MGFLSRLFGGAPAVHPTSVSTAAQFEALVSDGDLPVILDVWSPTCAPCKKLVPVLTEVATRHDGRVRVIEVNAAAAEPALLRILNVRATPTLVLYDGGEEIGRVTGFRPTSWFNEMIEVEFPATQA